jgi:hypothetical protein
MASSPAVRTPVTTNRPDRSPGDHVAPMSHDSPGSSVTRASACKNDISSDHRHTDSPEPVSTMKSYRCEDGNVNSNGRVLAFVTWNPNRTESRTTSTSTEAARSPCETIDSPAPASPFEFAQPARTRHAVISR